jgi:predicted permease
MFLPRWYYILRLRLRSIVQRRRAEDELAEELRFHLEERARDLIARGTAVVDAHDAAVRTFGGIEQRKEECRDARRVGWVEDFFKDLAYAARVMRRSPVFTSIAAMSLAIGIGASTAIFTVFDALVLRPLPVDRPSELRTAHAVIRLGGALAKTSPAVSFRVFREVESDRSVFAETLAFSRIEEPVVSDGGRVLRSPGGGLTVSPNYFTMLGVRTGVGRLFEPGADSTFDQTVVISDRFWRRELGADARIIDRPLQINGRTFVVLGVAPPGFFGLTIGRSPDFFIPIDPSSANGGFSVQMVGRIKANTSDKAAAEWLTAALVNVLGPSAAGKPTPVAEVFPIDTGLSDVRARVSEPLSILMIMVLVLLLVAAANVATMLLARGSARRTEMLIRASIGAGRSRLLRQLATESFLLLAIAAASGVLLASWGTQALLALMQYLDAPLSVETPIDARVLLFAIVACTLVGVVTSLVPALYTSRNEANSALKERHDSGALAQDGRLGRSFVVLQVALSLTLVASAVLLARTLYTLTTLDAGFTSDGVVLAAVNPGARSYDRPALAAYFTRTLEKLRQMPGVEHVSLVQFSFLTDARTTGSFDAPGFVPSSDEDQLIQVFQVGPEFFATMRIPLLKGRDFGDSDMSAQAHSVALNETAARRFFGGRDPVGLAITNPNSGRQLQVIAVVKDGRYNSLREPASAVVFVPYASAGRVRMTYALRMIGNLPASRHLQRVESELRTIDPLVPLRVETLDAVIARSLGQERMIASIAGFFAVVALLLLALGLYGLMAYWVTARTAEIGVRLALGAQRFQVIWNVVRRPLLLILAGVLIGITVTIASGRYVSHLLFGLVPEDPMTLAAAMAFLIGVAVFASIFPARRATRIDPVVALRCE